MGTRQFLIKSNKILSVAKIVNNCQLDLLNIFIYYHCTKYILRSTGTVNLTYDFFLKFDETNITPQKKSSVHIVRLAVRQS